MPTEKEIELTQLIDFCRAASINFDNILSSECPDFICDLDGKKIGVEITVATHPNTAKFQVLAIEKAQSDFARALQDAVGAEAGVVMGISFEDGVPVTKNDQKSMHELAVFIQKEAEKLGNPDGITLWAEKWNQNKPKDNKRLTAPLPAFMQNICLYRDGDHETLMGGGRGGVLPDFDDETLHPILASKNERLIGYQNCDEHWLVIVSSVMALEEQSPQSGAATFNMTSFGTCFGAVNITTPIPSNFDATYFFKWPTDVHEL